jgi:hypothetical protein
VLKICSEFFNAFKRPNCGNPVNFWLDVSWDKSLMLLRIVTFSLP